MPWSSWISQLDTKNYTDFIQRDNEPSLFHLVDPESTFTFGGVTTRQETDVGLRKCIEKDGKYDTTRASDASLEQAYSAL